MVLNVCLGHGSPHSLNPVETQFTSVVSGSPLLVLELLGCRVQVIRGGDGHGSLYSESTQGMALPIQSYSRQVDVGYKSQVSSHINPRS